MLAPLSCAACSVSSTAGTLHATCSKGCSRGGSAAAAHLRVLVQRPLAVQHCDAVNLCIHWRPGEGWKVVRLQLLCSFSAAVDIVQKQAGGLPGTMALPSSAAGHIGGVPAWPPARPNQGLRFSPAVARLETERVSRASAPAAPMEMPTPPATREMKSGGLHDSPVPACAAWCGANPKPVVGKGGSHLGGCGNAATNAHRSSLTLLLAAGCVLVGQGWRRVAATPQPSPATECTCLVRHDKAGAALSGQPHACLLDESEAQAGAQHQLPAQGQGEGRGGCRRGRGRVPQARGSAGNSAAA